MDTITFDISDGLGELPFDDHYSTLFGKIDDSFFLMRTVDKRIFVIQFPYENVSKETGQYIGDKWKELMDLKPKKERAKLKRFNQHKKGYTAQIIGNKHSLTEENILLAINLMKDSLIERDEKPLNICTKCNVTTDQLVYSKGNIIPFCESCMDDLENNSFGETQGYQYFTGLLGAILGGIVGCIPYIAFAFISNTLVGVLAFLFGFISIKGYELFKGPRKRWYANLVVIPITIINTLLVSMFFSLGDMSNAAFTMLFGLFGIIYVVSESNRFVNADKPIILNKKEELTESAIIS